MGAIGEGAFPDTIGLGLEPVRIKVLLLSGTFVVDTQFHLTDTVANVRKAL